MSFYFTIVYTTDYNRHIVYHILYTEIWYTILWYAIPYYDILYIILYTMYDLANTSYVYVCIYIYIYTHIYIYMYVYTILYDTILYHTILCYAILCYTMLYYTILYTRAGRPPPASTCASAARQGAHRAEDYIVIIALCVYIYIYIYMYVYVYIYIYICIGVRLSSKELPHVLYNKVIVLNSRACKCWHYDH